MFFTNFLPLLLTNFSNLSLALSKVSLYLFAKKVMFWMAILWPGVSYFLSSSERKNSLLSRALSSESPLPPLKYFYTNSLI